MQVELTKPELAKFVDEKVKTGEFPSAAAVIENALTRMMEDDEVLTNADLAAIESSDAQIDRGEYIEFDAFTAETRKKYRAE